MPKEGIKADSIGIRTWDRLSWQIANRKCKGDDMPSGRTQGIKDIC